MAGRKTKRKRARRATRRPTPGWIWMLFGLAVGLSVAASIYINDRSLRHAAAPAPESPTTKPRPLTSARTASKAKPARRFEFYEMLPKFEVVIPEEEKSVRPDVARTPVELPGIYVLQAGSFSNFSDADRVKAQLALLGIASRIQRVSIDDKVYHRVRIGPMESLDSLNTLRQQLRQAEIEVIVIRVGD